MRMLVLAVSLAATASSALAQRRGTPFDQSSNWLSISGGIGVFGAVTDGRTGSTWDFGNGWPLRASIEHSLGGGTTLGVQATYARVPLVYSSTQSCGGCDAHATIAAYGPVLRVGRGTGWYQVVELFAGLVQYGNFTEDANGLTLPPDSPNKDFAFSYGFGIGHAIGRGFDFELMTSQLRAIHERTNLPGNAQTMISHNTFALGLRMRL